MEGIYINPHCCSALRARGWRGTAAAQAHRQQQHTLLQSAAAMQGRLGTLQDILRGAEAARAHRQQQLALQRVAQRGHQQRHVRGRRRPRPIHAHGQRRRRRGQLPPARNARGPHRRRRRGDARCGAAPCARGRRTGAWRGSARPSQGVGGRRERGSPAQDLAEPSGVQALAMYEPALAGFPPPRCRHPPPPACRTVPRDQAAPTQIEPITSSCGCHGSRPAAPTRLRCSADAL
jgi:hypothetical protein